jgi:vacuolar-type H+-ATPase subunit E/Vma4
VRKAFRKTFERLRSRARWEAEEQVASAVDDIKRADQTILEIASQLPQNLRQRIAQKRRELTARIMALDPSSKGHGRANADGKITGDVLQGFSHRN